MARMQDVARLAGVSTATVSAVVNSKGCVSEKLTKRIKEAMEMLDYHPDHVARSLRVGHTNMIGMIVPDVTNPFFTELMRGVEDAAEQKGYSVMLCDSNEDPAREERHLRMLASRRADGVLMARSVSDAHYDRRMQRCLPIVFVDCLPIGTVSYGAVVIDNVGAAREATKHLIDLGHKRLAIITGKLDRSVGLDRLEGFRMAMQQANLLIPQEYLQPGDFHVESGYRCGLELMRLAAPPTAIFSCNNRMSLGLMRALGELGVACPSHVSVVGFDEADWATIFSPKLTCVAQPSYNMGQQAMSMLLRRVESSPENSDKEEEPVVVLRAEFCVRESTAPPPEPIAEACVQISRDKAGSLTLK